MGPTTVTLWAETSIPAVCALVSGPTPVCGNIATHNDMTGGGHTAATTR